LQSWTDEKGATLEQSAARHQRLLRDLSPAVLDRLEALCCFAAQDLFEVVGAARSNPKLLEALRVLHEKDD